MDPRSPYDNLMASISNLDATMEREAVLVQAWGRGLPARLEEVTWLKRKGGRTLSHLIDPRTANAAERLDRASTDMPTVVHEVTFCGRAVPFASAVQKYGFNVEYGHRFENVYDACLRCGLTRKAAVERDYTPSCLIVACKLCMEQLRLREDETATANRRPVQVVAGVANYS